MQIIRCFWVTFLLLIKVSIAYAHETTTTYLGNAALLVKGDKQKILFDPFFHKNFGIYRLVPQDIHIKVMAGEAPYDNIDAIFISHAHDDHFDAKDVVNYLKKHRQVQLVIPEQALSKLQAAGLPETELNRVHSISAAKEDKPKQLVLGDINVNAIPIPHAGYPHRFKDVENMLFQVTLGKENAATVIHMGDAGDKYQHFSPYKAHWQQHPTDISFPPYWFLMSAEGRDILNEMIQSKRHIGIHVPKAVPKYLHTSGQEYFSEPGKVIELD